MRRRLWAAGAVLALAATLVTGCARVSTVERSVGSASFNGCGARTVDGANIDVQPLVPAPRPVLPVTVASADGRRVTVTDASRILAIDLYGSLAEIVFSLGLGDRVVGRDTATTFPAAAGLPLVTPAGHDLSAEGILRLNPTVVLTDTTIGPAVVIEQIRSAGIPVVFFAPDRSLESVPTRVAAVAAALGVADAAQAVVDRFEADLAAAAYAVPDEVDRPMVAFLYLRGTAGIYLIGGDGAGSDAMIEAAGGRDAGSELGLVNFRPLTAEALAAAAPDVLLVMSGGLRSVGGVDSLLAMAGIAQTPAAQHRRVIDVDDGFLLNFGTRTPEVVRAITTALWCR
jgi:iron complex transport system substrate-binding protein